MTANSALAHNGKAAQPSADGERIRACSIALSSGSSQLGNLQWSALGQALVVTDDCIVILSPLTGLHPTLAGQSRTQHVECHPDWKDRFPHSVAQINVKTFLENEQTIRRRILLESDHSAVDPRFQSVQWSSASWSKPGMGPHGSCLILATTSELDLFILGAPLNAWTGEWKLLHAVTLNPVAALTELDAPPSSNEKEVFSRTRALLRKKQMATEAVCASFVDLGQSTHIVAGTRSGHIALWECAAVSGQCTFVSATPVSSMSIEQLIVTSRIGAGPTDVQATIAFQDADGVKMCDFYLLEGKAAVRLSTLQPITSDHFRITTWRWVKDQLVFSSIGRVHVFDTTTQRTTIFALGTGFNNSLDPYSPVIDISECSDSAFNVKVVLQDLREYRIPNVTANHAPSAPQVLLPTSLPSRLLGYPPMTENLQRKHDLHQAFLGYAVDSSSRLPSACIVGSVRTSEKVAFLGFNSSENITYQMEVLRPANLSPVTLLEEALARVDTGMLPYLAARNILAALYISQQQGTLPLNSSQQQGMLHDQLASAIQGRWTATTGLTTNYSQQQQQLLYLLACRLQGSASDSTSPLDALMTAHRGSVLHNWLQRHNVSSTSLGTAEQCAACDTPLSFYTQDEFGWARCQKGHVWPRCSVTLAILSDRQVRVCTGCWSKSRMPHKVSEKEGESSSRALMLKAAATCLYCGGHWIVR